MNDTMVKIEKYFSGTSQYPLLVVISLDEYRDILRKFSSVRKIRVSDYCVGMDKEPDIERLQEDVKTFAGNYLLLGLGDYLVNKGNSAKNFLTPYKDLVLHPQSHVAILLSAYMYPAAKELVSSDLRVKSRIILPSMAPQIPKVENNAFVYGIKAYLESCEKGEFVGNVKSARKIPNATVINPESAFDELKHRYPSEFSKLSKSNGTSANWSDLLTAVNDGKKNILQYLIEQKFATPEYIFLKHAKADDYTAWLYLLWLKLQQSCQSYLGIVAANTETIENLLETAKTAILDICASDSRFAKFYDQRKVLLKDCSDADMASFTQQVYRQGADRIAYLTDNTKVEKQAIIISLGEGAKSDYLKMSYPDLYAYLQDYRLSDDNITAYFSAYKKCKVYNKVDEAFERIVASNATSRPYNALPSRISLFSGIDTSKTSLIFLDALGVEFLGYVKEVCAELKLRVAVSIARANLPTVTSANKEFYDGWQGSKEPPIKGIDELKHHPERGYDFNNSPYPIHLSEELGVIRAALERAVTKLSSGECRRVVIASDHGASRLAVISTDAQIDSGTCESKSNGRYCQGKTLPVGENIARESDCAVIADYSRFSGSRIASVEVHGGATLEEIVVPIIELTLADSNIQVMLENSIIEISYKKKPELILIITPDCDGITASINGVIYEAEKLEKSRFKVTMPDLKKGSYTLDVFENQNKIACKEFSIKSKGFAERDIF